jgi:perosamine synthetase
MTTASASSKQSASIHARFGIGFDHRDRERLHTLIDEILDCERWSEGELSTRFEAAWERWNDAPAVAVSSWSGGALAALHFAGVEGETVLCPSNTFMATPLAAIRAGADVQFVDCNREDLCMSFADFEAKVERYRPKAAFLVHIGGHIAFDVEEIAAYCREHGIFLIEDCAHAHGASWNGRKAGTYGDAGVYSLYATKTISTGEGGVLVSRRSEVIDHARAFRNYGKPAHQVAGLNFRMSEFTAALGLVQIERLPEIVAWKNHVARSELDPAYAGRLRLPQGMVSGLYKYIVFDWLERSTGRVYEEPCHRIMGHPVQLPNTDWVARNHSCVPLYYRPDHQQGT